MVAFMLNIAAVFLVSAGSGLVLTLAGVFKDILLISGSVLIFGALITPLQVLGTSSLLDRTSCAARMCTNRALDRLLDRAPWSHPLQDHRQQVSVGRKVLSVVSRTLPCRPHRAPGLCRLATLAGAQPLPYVLVLCFVYIRTWSTIRCIYTAYLL